MDEKLFTKVSKSVEETENIGKEFAKNLKKGDFIALYGDLGSGKTAFVRGLAASLCPSARICSPTYTIMHKHENGNCPFYHFDMYRIHSEEDLESVGFYDCEGVIAAEWCENIPFALPKSYFKVEISKVSDSERQIDIFSADNRF